MAAADPPGGPDQRADSVGGRLRKERERQRIGLRELARRVNVSASLISQVELGRATPSVGTLYAIVHELGMSLDELFFESETVRPEGTASPNGTTPRAALEPARLARPERDASHPPARGLTPVVRRGEGQSIQLDSGVRWTRLTTATEHDVDFLYVVYEVGGASCAPDALMRHSGKEYGHLLEGCLDVTVGFDTYRLGPGDSVSFDSTVPHRLANPGTERAEGIWFIVGRNGDPRIATRAEGGANVARPETS